jgi:phosphate-selective porin OprO/OprP
MKSTLLGAVNLIVLATIATPAFAQDAAPIAADVPLTPTERLLMERLEKQDAEIRALKEQLTEVSSVLSTRVATVEAATDSGKVFMTGPSPRLESAKSDFSISVVGTVQPQVAFYSQSGRGPGAPTLNNGTDFRRAQLGIQGTAFGDFNYQLVFDGASLNGVASSIRDAFVAYVGLRPFTFTFGNQKPQNGLEPSFSDRSNASTFLEPGLPAQLATANGTRAIGARISAGGNHYSASLGLFGDDINNANIATPYAEGWGVHGRLTLAPINKSDRLIHLGVSGFWREPGTTTPTTAEPINSQLRFRAQPEVTPDATRLVDTGLLTRVDNYTYLGLEAAGVYGPFSVQGEYAKSWVDQAPSRVDLAFDGAYAMASVFLTGESRVYDARTGVFTRMSPKHPFGKSGGLGAFELAARWSQVDLDSHENELALGGVRGGKLTDYTVALNWYLNPYLRVMLNYIHADAEKRSATNVDQGTNADIVALRLHQEW